MAGPMTLAQIVTRLGGRVAGASDTLIHQVGSLETADSHQISFYTGKRHRAKLDATKAGAVIVSADCEGDTRRPRIVADNPYLYFARVSQLFNPMVRQPAGVHASAVVAKSAKLGEGVSIGAGCVVGEDVVIGDGSCLYPRVVIYGGCKLGRRVIVHSGAVIGADGFGIADDNGHWVKIPQIGSVRIGDDVEIGANTTIDRGALDDTVIEEGVKLDNQIQIGHNTRIGAHTAIAGCVGIAGSADIGRHCTFGGAAMILGHLTIVDHVNISAGTFISRSILKPGTYTGIYPVDEHEAWARGAAWLRRKGKKHE
ncbi:MAG: UDP-3-O-(3-hydroxymyristoyl)glucosamine N-acyltransferase [Betaproteobacteria bacterium]|nr:UDP-3-O-(3-hydroxymyristoyl)glucosamine N-acyltransferase [Betaproteobacteria bacterium]MBV9361451.1 UDP-3-O-(3-hydroxymyristoyl)glucosamine N-acyltransferase [Betaproteobacteria bacterium]